MAKQSGRPHGRGASRSGKGPSHRSASGTRSNTPRSARSPAKIVFDARPEPEAPRTFRLGAVPGATPGKWIDTWKRRMPHVSIELVPIDPENQRAAIDELDAALIRLPLEDDSLHLITLYREVAVVVASTQSHLLVVDQLSADDLTGEVLITARDDVLGPLDLPTTDARFDPLETTADAIATAATGVGIVVVPMSLARLHHRKDVDYRPLLGAPGSAVALAWPRERTTADIETFVGIVRGRTSNSSR